MSHNSYNFTIFSCLLPQKGHLHRVSLSLIKKCKTVKTVAHYFFPFSFLIVPNNYTISLIIVPKTLSNFLILFSTHYIVRRNTVLIATFSTSPDIMMIIKPGLII